jgi:hypothetical protein
MIQRPPKHKLLLIIFVLTIGMLSSCQRGEQTPTATQIPPTPEPTATSTVVPASLWLVDPQSVAPAEITSVLNEYSSTNSLVFSNTTDVESDFSSAKIVVGFYSGDGLIEKAKNFPQAHFILIGDTNTGVPANVSLIHAKPEELAFMAGYLATLTAEDWRSGGLINAGAQPAGTLADAFVNGGEYVCGLCAPVYPPYISYPVYEDVSGKTQAAEMTTNIDALATQKVDTVFVAKSADFPEVLDSLIGAGSTLYGENLQSPEHSKYAAILDFDFLPGLEKLLPPALEGKAGSELNSVVKLGEINNLEKVTPGKQALFNQVAQDLSDGWIIPLSIP